MGRVGTFVRDEWEGLTERFKSMPSSRRTIVALAAVAAVLLIVLALVVALVLRPASTDTETYRDMLVDPKGSDLPASTFRGWVAEQRTEPPGVPEGDDAIGDASPADCVPGGDLHAAMETVWAGDARAWSGETLTLPAYNAVFSIDIANPETETLAPIDDWTKQCALTTYTKDGIEHRQKVQTMPLEKDRWGANESRLYVSTLTRLRDDRNLGTTSTVVVTSRVGERIAHGALTIRGSVTDDALRTVDLLWDKQVAKIKTG